MNIHQLLPGFADGDAISHEAFKLRNIFRSKGHNSEIFVNPAYSSPCYRDDSYPLSEYTGSKDDICIYHYGIASEATRLFLESSAHKIFLYHNVTPKEFFIGFDDKAAFNAQKARKELYEIANQANQVWADSEFNAQELKNMGIEKVKVFPLIFDKSRLDVKPDPVVHNKFKVSLTTILFVGRIVPNKCIKDLIYAFAYYHISINPYSRLVIVGSNRSCPKYYTMLRMLASELQLPNICFEGFASQSGLSTYYDKADVYVCPSLHEGYCLPLVEAMYKRVPVIARNIGGVPEAMGNAGVRYEDFNYKELAELINKIIKDPQLLKQIMDSQDLRLKNIENRNIEAESEKLIGI
jgi:L-malate glycosyltransferase